MSQPAEVASHYSAGTCVQGCILLSDHLKVTQQQDNRQETSQNDAVLYHFTAAAANFLSALFLRTASEHFQLPVIFC